jgi:hypothetical protein
MLLENTAPLSISFLLIFAPSCESTGSSPSVSQSFSGETLQQHDHRDGDDLMIISAHDRRVKHFSACLLVIAGLKTE